LKYELEVCGSKWSFADFKIIGVDRIGGLITEIRSR
jgi:hypothetical protein